MTTADRMTPLPEASGIAANLTKQCVLMPGLVTPELLAAAELRTDELFAALVAAKNEWQYAVKDQDDKYQRVLQMKAEYAEWRRLTERLRDIVQAPAHAAAQVPPVLPAARSGSGFAVPPLPFPPRRTGT